MAAALAVAVTAAVLAVQRDQSDTSALPEAILAVEQPSSAGQAQPPFRASVNLVRVDVYATTSSGPVLDLGQNDFEVYENGVLQKIGSFEHVVSRVPVPEFERTEPRSDAEAQDAVADLRNRLFVVLFDTLNTEGYRKDDKWAAPTYDPQSVGRELTMFLHRSIGEDDLVAVMHPEMSISSLRFTRRPSRFDEFLLSGAEWQRRFVDGLADEAERQYEACYGAPDGAGHLRRYGRQAPRDEAARHAAGTLRLAGRTARGAQGGVRGQRRVGTLPAGRAPCQATPGPSAIAARHREDPRQARSRPATRAATSPTRDASATA